VIEQYPEVGEATHAEWWAHCRPHASGHQLHFDSEDEGRGTVRHPIVSTVLYLTEGIGGPTLVTNQRLGDNLAERGWLAHPGLNRLTMFKGNVLHGVIPGRGIAPVPTAESGKARRITFMCAFWKV